MKPLDLGFWELLSVEPVLLPKGEMNPHLSFVEVYVREGILGAECGIESESELAYEDFAVLVVMNHLVEFLEFGWKIIGWKNSTTFYHELEWLTDTDTEIVPWIGVDEASSMDTGEIQCFGEYFAYGECTSFMFGLRVISGIAENSVGFSENELGTIS